MLSRVFAAMVVPSRLIILWRTISGETAGRNVADARQAPLPDVAPVRTSSVGYGGMAAFARTLICINVGIAPNRL